MTMFLVFKWTKDDESTGGMRNMQMRKIWWKKLDEIFRNIFLIEPPVISFQRRNDDGSHRVRKLP